MEELTKQSLEIMATKKHIKGVHLYEGTQENRHLVPQIMKLLQKCIRKEDNVRFRNINELYRAFDNQPCIYATDELGNVIGFVYLGSFNKKEHSKKNFISIFTLIVDEKYRGRGLGEMLKRKVHILAETKFPQLDLISISSNPAVIRINQKLQLKEIGYRYLWDIYGFNMLTDCENYLNLEYRLKNSKGKSDDLDNVEIVDMHTGNIKRIFIRKA